MLGKSQRCEESGPCVFAVFWLCTGAAGPAQSPLSPWAAGLGLVSPELGVAVAASSWGDGGRLERTVVMCIAA